MKHSHAHTGPDEPDLFRDTPVRFLGYTNEIGEAFKRFLPRIGYLGTYAVSIAYALSDAAHKGNQAYHTSKADHVPYDPHIAGCAAVADTALWQGLASVALPGLAINRVVAMSRVACRHIPMPPTARLLIPTFVGLGAIPVIISPIDRLVDYGMDSYFRPWLHRAQIAMSSQQQQRHDTGADSSSQSSSSSSSPSAPNDTLSSNTTDR